MFNLTEGFRGDLYRSCEVKLKIISVRNLPVFFLRVSEGLGCPFEEINMLQKFSFEMETRPCAFACPLSFSAVTRQHGEILRKIRKCLRADEGAEYRGRGNKLLSWVHPHIWISIIQHAFIIPRLFLQRTIPWCRHFHNNTWMAWDAVGTICTPQTEDV